MRGRLQMCRKDGERKCRSYWMETQLHSELIAIIVQQAKIIEKLMIDNAEKENLIEFLLEGESREKIII